LAYLAILDVGHGNCAILHDDEGTIVIDGGRSQTLLQFLQAEELLSIDAILVSHADDDHLGGIIEVLLARNIEVQRIFLNPDALRRTKVDYVPPVV
jgi:competence protein ComEC